MSMSRFWPTKFADILFVESRNKNKVCCYIQFASEDAASRANSKPVEDLDPKDIRGVCYSAAPVLGGYSSKTRYVKHKESRELYDRVSSLLRDARLKHGNNSRPIVWDPEITKPFKFLGLLEEGQERGLKSLEIEAGTTYVQCKSNTGIRIHCEGDSIFLVTGRSAAKRKPRSHSRYREEVALQLAGNYPGTLLVDSEAMPLDDTFARHMTFGQVLGETSEDDEPIQIRLTPTRESEKVLGLGAFFFTEEGLDFEESGIRLDSFGRDYSIARLFRPGHKTDHTSPGHYQGWASTEFQLNTSILGDTTLKFGYIFQRLDGFYFSSQKTSTGIYPLLPEGAVYIASAQQNNFVFGTKVRERIVCKKTRNDDKPQERDGQYICQTLRRGNVENSQFNPYSKSTTSWLCPPRYVELLPLLALYRKPMGVQFYLAGSTDQEANFIASQALDCELFSVRGTPNFPVINLTAEVGPEGLTDINGQQLDYDAVLALSDRIAAKRQDCFLEYDKKSRVSDGPYFILPDNAPVRERQILTTESGALFEAKKFDEKRLELYKVVLGQGTKDRFFGICGDDDTMPKDAQELFCSEGFNLVMHKMLELPKDWKLDNKIHLPELEFEVDLDNPSDACQPVLIIKRDTAYSLAEVIENPDLWVVRKAKPEYEPNTLSQKLRSLVDKARSANVDVKPNPYAQLLEILDDPSWQGTIAFDVKATIAAANAESLRDLAGKALDGLRAQYVIINSNSVTKSDDVNSVEVASAISAAVSSGLEAT